MHAQRHGLAWTHTRKTGGGYSLSEAKTENEIWVAIECDRSDWHRKEREAVKP